MRAVVLAAALPLALAACGSTRALKPAPGTSMPVAPEGAAQVPSVGDLLTPSVQARPSRNREVLTRSQEREPDDFDLPPR